MALTKARLLKHDFPVHGNHLRAHGVQAKLYSARCSDHGRADGTGSRGRGRMIVAIFASLTPQ